MNVSQTQAYEFGEFRIDADKRLLSTSGGDPVSLMPKAFDTLLYLVEHHGKIIEKDELMSAIWPDTIVEENNLSQNISILRRTLGEKRGDHRFIATVPGRGFKFVADVREAGEAEKSSSFNHPVGDHPVCRSGSHPSSNQEGSFSEPPALAGGLKAAEFQVLDYEFPKGNQSETEDLKINEDRKLKTEDQKPSRFWFAAILIAALAGLSFLGFNSWREDTKAVPISSVAVLPFVNVGGDADLDYLSDGLSETLIDRLSELPQLKVIARNSSFKYRGANFDLQEVARKLAVQAIVTGRVTRRGDDLSIRVELIDARDNKQIWGEQFNRKTADAVLLEGEIARTVSGKLRLKLSGTQDEHLAKNGTTNPQAYDLVLRGDFQSRKKRSESPEKAVDYYNQAIALDPSYSLAYARLSNIYGLIGHNNWGDPKIALPKAEAAARKALELDPDLADTHLALAMAALNSWNWKAAEDSYQRALTLNPNYALASRRYSRFLSVTGRHEQAIAEARRARELDPQSLITHFVVAQALYIARRFDESIAETGKTLELNHKSAAAHDSLGFAYFGKGMYRESLASRLESVRLGNTGPSAEIYLGAAYARVGETDKARAILRRLENGREYVSPGELAILVIALGEHEKAIALLEKAYAAHDLQLQFLNADFHYDPLRDDPRFQDLVRRVGLP